MNEPDRTDLPLLAVLGLSLTAVLVAFVYAARGLSERAGSRLSERRSEDSTPSLLAVERAEQQAELRGYRWIDRSEGRVAIPIERAMQRVEREYAGASEEVDFQ